MRFREILRFEVGHHLKRPATWFYLALLLVLSFLRADSTDVEVVRYHAPAMAVFSMLMVGVLAMLITAALFAEAAHRDVRSRMDPLFYTLPLGRWDYLGGRFLGALMINALLLLAIPAGLLLGPRMLTLNPETVGPLHFEAYLLPFFIFLLPNLLVSAAVFFGVTVLSRRSLPAYIGGIGLTAAYLLTVLTVWPDSSWMALLDPTGAVALSAQTQGWTRIELNTRLIELEGLLLWNRLFWATLAAGMLAFTIRRFRFAHAEPGSRSRRAREAEAASARKVIIDGSSVAVSSAPRSFGPRIRLHQTLAVTWMGIRQTVLSRDFILIMIALVIFVLLKVLGGMSGRTPLWPVTPEVAAALTDWVMQTMIALLTAFYAGELVWKERDAGIEKIGDSVPVPSWTLFVGKLIALGVLLVVLQTVLMASGMLVQTLQDYFILQPGKYIKILFGLQLPEYLLFAVLALLVHVLVNQKYVGHLVASLLFVALLQAPRLGIDHNLLVYGSDAGWVYSDLNGIDPFLKPFVWFKLYWAAWALLLGVIALLFWVRGTEVGVRRRLHAARQRFSRRLALGGAAAVLLVLTTGGFVFYNTNVLGEYRTDWEAEEVNAEYERRYKRYEHAPQPRLTGIWLHAEVYPDQGEASMHGTYRLVNRTEEPIDAVHVTSMPAPGITLDGIIFDRPTRLALEDGEHGYRIYSLVRALEPGDSLQMEFELRVQRRGFQNREKASQNRPMVGEVTNLGSWLLPAIGYQRGPELSSAKARRKHGLPPGEFRPSIHDLQSRRVPRIAPWSDWIRFEATVGTKLDQIAVLPGTLQRSWTEGDRRYFHYRSETPILNFFALLCGKYSVREAQWNDVEIQVLYHPDHRFNVEHMVHNLQASLAYFSEQLGPYPYRQLRLIEFPRYGRGARAYAGNIMYTESVDIALARMDGGEAEGIDSPLMITAHEVAHQWWGQQVMGADVQGSTVLSETLAQYSATMVLKRTHGRAHVQRFLQGAHERYLTSRGRNRTPEVPLLLTTDHAYIHYYKGAVVMYALQDYIGEDSVNTALRRMIDKQAYKGPPYATTLDLYEELQAVTPDSLQYLLEDLMATITLWDLQAIGARAEPIGTGDWRVTLDVNAAKVRADSAGAETEVPMNDVVEIGVFAAPKDGEVGEPLYLEKHRISSGEQRITVIVRGKPARAGIDPRTLLIDRDLGDNSVEIVASRRPVEHWDQTGN